VKIHDFGLWFKTWWTHKWSTIIPETRGFAIYYDGKPLGGQSDDFDLRVYNDEQFIIKLKNEFAVSGSYHKIGRRLTLDDFEIVPNPNNPGAK
jgi:hypothetical protein